MNANDRSHRPGAAEAPSAPLQSLSEAERTLLIVDDDAPLCQRLARAMEPSERLATEATAIMDCPREVDGA